MSTEYDKIPVKYENLKQYDEKIKDKIRGNTPQLLFSGVTSEAAPAIVDLSGYEMIKVCSLYYRDGVRSSGDSWDISASTISKIKSNSLNAISYPWDADKMLILTFDTTPEGLTTIHDNGGGAIAMEIYGIRQRTVLKIYSQPQDVTVAVGETAIFHVGVQGDGLAYQWQYYDLVAEIWKNVPSAMGGNRSTANCTNRALKDNGQYFRCIITDKYGNTVTSNVVTQTVISHKIYSQPQDVTCAVGDTITFSVGVQGDGLVYKWMGRSVGTETWYEQKNNSTISGAGTPNIIYTPIASWAGKKYEYYCEVTDKYGNTVTSDTATLTVTS